MTGSAFWWLNNYVPGGSYVADRLWWKFGDRVQPRLWADDPRWSPGVPPRPGTPVEFPFTPRKRPPPYGSPERRRPIVEIPIDERLRDDEPHPVVIEEETSEEPKEEGLLMPHSYKDLGVINLRKHGKGGWKGDRFDKDDATNSYNMEEYGWNIVTIPGSKKKFGDIVPQTINAPIADVGGTISVLDFGPLAPAKFNSCEQVIAGSNACYTSYVSPEYSNASMTAKIVDSNDATALCCLRNQQLYIRFKNVTANVASDTSISESPLFISCIAVQAKKDITQPLINSSGSYLEALLANGFQQTHDGFVGTAPYANSLEQPVNVTWRDNAWYNDNFDFLAGKRFVLEPGQEAHLRFVLSPPQILSSKFKLNNVVGDYTGTLKWAPVMIKKGEIRFFYSVYSGIAQFDDQGLNFVTTEPGKMLVHISRQYTAFGLNKDKGKVHRQYVETPIGAGILQPDVDVQHNST
jgi:hypothetical protein